MVFSENINTLDLTTKGDYSRLKTNKQHFKTKENNFRKALEGIKGKVSETKSESNKNQINDINENEQTINKSDSLKAGASKVLDEEIDVKIPEKTKEDFIELLDLVFAVSGTNMDRNRFLDLMDSLEVKELRNAFKDLISKAVIDNESSINNYQTIFFQSEYVSKTLNNSNNLMGDLKSIADKLVNAVKTDEDFKALLAYRLSLEPQKLMSLRSEDLKEALISKIYTMAEGKESLEAEDNSKLMEAASLFALKDSEEEVINAVDSRSASEELKEYDNNLKTKSNVFSEDGGEDLLENFISNKENDDKENTIAMRISNAVTRMETFKGEKSLEPQQKPIITRSNFNVDFVKAVKYMDVNNIKELSVKVIPKELGEIVIRLTMDNGIMKANITAHNKETFELLNSNLPIINNELAKQNVTIQNFSLSLYNGDNFLFNGNGSFEGNGANSQKRGTRSELMEQEEVTSENSSFEDNTVNILA